MLTLDPYQDAGVDWLAGNRRAGLGDDPGLGKSAQAIRAAARVGAQSVGVVCRAVARTNWQRQFDLWKPDGFAPELRIASYNEISGGAFDGWSPDVLVLDEAHYLKTVSSQRTRAVYGTRCAGGALASRAGWVWPLSGTFSPNGSPLEFYSHLRALRPDLITHAGRPMGVMEFLDEFCIYQNGAYGLRVVGVRDVARLRAILRQFILRRTEGDVAQYLPEIRWSSETLDSEDAAHILSQLEDRPEVRALAERLETRGDFRAYDEMHIATLRRVIGELKAPVLGGVLAEDLRVRPGKMLVFGHHHSVLNAVHGHLSDFGAVQLTGATPRSQVPEIINRFQTDPTCRALIGQTEACGESIELTAANRAEFVEWEWSEGRMYQAVKRMHRRGVDGSRPVFARVWGLAGSIDEIIARVCVRKQNNLQLIES